MAPSSPRPSTKRPERRTSRPRASPHRQPAPSHPKLARFRALSKRTAERDHDRLAPTRPQPVTHTATRRQISNKRSAEICRAAKNIYISLLEREILVEEQKQIDSMQQLLIQTEANAALRIRTLDLEHRLARVSASWLAPSGPASADNLAQDNTKDAQDFFLDGSLQEDGLHHRDVDWILDDTLAAQPSAEQLQNVMDFQPSSGPELSDSETEYTADDLSVARSKPYSLTEHSSPVAIFDTAPDVPVVADLLRPCLRDNHPQA